MGPMAAAVGLLSGAAWAAALVTLVTLVGGLVANIAIPRLANLFLEEGRVYPLFGFHHSLEQLVELVSNSAFFNLVFGDSVFIERYLRALGWKLAKGTETGSNFGSDQSHDNPGFVEIGANTVASDGLRMGNVSMSSHGFRIGTARVGADSFLGAMIYVPAGRADGRQRALRQQGAGSDRWAGARERRPARLARLRDSRAPRRATSRRSPPSVRPNGRAVCA